MPCACLMSESRAEPATEHWYLLLSPFTTIISQNNSHFTHTLSKAASTEKQSPTDPDTNYTARRLLAVRGMRARDATSERLEPRMHEAGFFLRARQVSVEQRTHHLVSRELTPYIPCVLNNLDRCAVCVKERETETVKNRTNGKYTNTHTSCMWVPRSCGTQVSSQHIKTPHSACTYTSKHTHPRIYRERESHRLGVYTQPLCQHNPFSST